MTFTDHAEEQAVIAELNTARDAEVLGRLPELPRELADDQARGNVTYAEVEEPEADLQRFRSWMDKIATRDYFAAPAGQDARGGVPLLPDKFTPSGTARNGHSVPHTCRPDRPTPGDTRRKTDRWAR